jgi:hypothetical protein
MSPMCRKYYRVSVADEKENIIISRTLLTSRKNTIVKILPTGRKNTIVKILHMSRKIK